LAAGEAEHLRTAGHRSRARLALAVAATSLAVLARAAGAASPAEREASRSGEQIYADACVACHGVRGAGAPRALRGFELQPPNFTDCNFATREGNADWLAMVHRGGPARGFDPMMPAFGGALTDEEIDRVIAYLRTFCAEPGWPRGELNLPRAFFTEKAYPEDEAVLTSGIALQGRGSVANELAYEKRLTKRVQMEIAVPVTFQDIGGTSGWVGGIGDIALAVKGVVLESLPAGSILSAGAELTFPTGDEARGLGTGTWAASPFLAYGQLLPASAFVQAQAGAELPFDTAKAPNEWFARAALGRIFTMGRWGRLVTPMVEALATREIAPGAEIQWDLVPQMQVTLSTRQHVRADVGVRVPLYRPSAATELHLYLLWDWFDGGLGEGW
jgi:mono/diheme cytochrome c family protein